MSIPPSLTRSPYVLWDSVPRHAVTAMAVGAGVLTGSDSGDIIAWKYDRESHLRSIAQQQSNSQIVCDSNSLFPQVFTLSHTGCSIASIVNVVTHQGTYIQYDKSDASKPSISLAFTSPISHFIALHNDGTIRAHTPTSSESYTITTDSPHHSVHGTAPQIDKDGNIMPNTQSAAAAAQTSSSNGGGAHPHRHTPGGFTGLHVFYPTNYYWGFNSLNSTMSDTSSTGGARQDRHQQHAGQRTAAGHDQVEVPDEGFFSHTQTNSKGQVILSSSYLSYSVDDSTLAAAHYSTPSSANQLQRSVATYSYNTNLLSSYHYVNPLLIVHGTSDVVKLIDLLTGRTVCKLHHNVGVVRCDFSSSNAYSTLAACHIDPSSTSMPSSPMANSGNGDAGVDPSVLSGASLALPDPFSIGLLNVSIGDNSTASTSSPSVDTLDVEKATPKFSSQTHKFPHNHSNMAQSYKDEHNANVQQQFNIHEKPLAIRSQELTSAYQRKRFLHVLTADGVVHIWDLDRVLHTQARHVIAQRLMRYQSQQQQQQQQATGGPGSALGSNVAMSKFLQFSKVFRHVPLVRYYVGPPDINAIYYLTREVTAPLGVIHPKPHQSNSIASRNDLGGSALPPHDSLSFHKSSSSSVLIPHGSPSIGATPYFSGASTPYTVGSGHLGGAIGSPRLVSALAEANVTGDLSSGHKQLALPPTCQLSDQPLAISLNDGLGLTALIYPRVILLLNQTTLTLCGSIFLPVLSDLPEGNTSPSYFCTAMWLHDGRMLCVCTDSCILAFHIYFERSDSHQRATKAEKQRLLDEYTKADKFQEQHNIRQINLTNHVFADLCHILPMFHHMYSVCPSNDYSGVFLTYLTHDDLGIGSLNKLNMYALASTTKTTTHLEYYAIPLPREPLNRSARRKAPLSSRISSERAWLLDVTLKQLNQQLPLSTADAFHSRHATSTVTSVSTLPASRSMITTTSATPAAGSSSRLTHSISGSSRTMVSDTASTSSASASGPYAQNHHHPTEAGAAPMGLSSVGLGLGLGLSTGHLSNEILMKCVKHVLRKRQKQLASILPIFVSNDLHMITYHEINLLTPLLASDTHTSIDRYNEDSDSDDDSDDYVPIHLQNSNTSLSDVEEDPTFIDVTSKSQLSAPDSPQYVNKIRSYAQHCLVSQVITDVQTGSIVLVRGFRSGHIVFVNITTNSPPFVITHPLYPFYSSNSPGHPYSVPYPVGLTSVFIMGICGVCVLFSDSSLAIYTVNTALSQPPPQLSTGSSEPAPSLSPFSLYNEPSSSSVLLKDGKPSSTATKADKSTSDGDKPPLLVSTIHGALQTGINSFFHPSLPLTQLMSALSIPPDYFTSKPPPSITSAVTMMDNKLYLSSSDMHKHPKTGLSSYIKHNYPNLPSHLSTNPTYASHVSQLLPLQSTFVSLHMCVQAPPSNQIYNSVHYLESFATRYSHDSRLCVADTQSQMLMGGWLNEINNHRKHQIYKNMVEASGYNTNGLVDRIQNVVDVEDGSWKSPFPSLIYPSLPIVSPATTIHPGECIFVTSTQHELFVISLLDRTKTFTLAPHSSPVLKVVHNHHCVLSNAVLTFTAKGQIYVWSLTDSSLLEVIYRSIHDVWRSINPLHWLPLYFHVDIPIVRNVLVNMHFNSHFSGRNNEITDQDLYVSAAITQHASTLADLKKHQEFMMYDQALEAAISPFSGVPLASPDAVVGGDTNPLRQKSRTGRGNRDDSCGHNIYLPDSTHASKNCPYCIARAHNIIVDIHFKQLTQQLRGVIQQVMAAPQGQHEVILDTLSDKNVVVDDSFDENDIDALDGVPTPTHTQKSRRPKLPSNQYTDYLQSSYPSLSDNCHLIIMQPNYSRLQSYLLALCGDVQQLLQASLAPSTSADQSHGGTPYLGQRSLNSGSAGPSPAPQLASSVRDADDDHFLLENSTATQSISIQPSSSRPGVPIHGKKSKHHRGGSSGGELLGKSFNEQSVDAFGLPPLMSLPSVLQQFLPDPALKTSHPGKSSLQETPFTTSGTQRIPQAGDTPGETGSVAGLSDYDQMYYRRVFHHGKSALAALFEIEKYRIQKLINMASSKIADILKVDDTVMSMSSSANAPQPVVHRPVFSSTIPLTSTSQLPIGKGNASGTTPTPSGHAGTVGSDFVNVQNDRYADEMNAVIRNYTGNDDETLYDDDDDDGNSLFVVNDPHMHSLLDHCYYLSLIELQTRQLAGVAIETESLHLHKQIVIDHISAHKTGNIPLISLDMHTNNKIPLYNSEVQKIWYDYQQQQRQSTSISQNPAHSVKETYLPASRASSVGKKGAIPLSLGGAPTLHTSDFAESWFRGPNCSLLLPFNDPMNTCDLSGFQTLNIYESDGDVDMCPCHDCSLYLKLNTRSFPYNQWLDKQHRATRGSTGSTTSMGGAVSSTSLGTSRLRSGSTTRAGHGTIRLGDVTRGKFRLSGISGCDINHTSLYTHSLTHSCNQHKIWVARDQDTTVCTPCEREMAGIAPFMANPTSLSSSLLPMMMHGGFHPNSTSTAGHGLRSRDTGVVPYSPQQIATLQMVNSIRSNAYYQEYAYHKGVSTNVVLYANSNIVFSYNHTRKLLQEKQDIVRASQSVSAAVAAISELQEGGIAHGHDHSTALTTIAHQSDPHHHHSSYETAQQHTLASSGLPHITSSVNTNPLLSTPVLYQGQSSVTMNDSSYPSLSMVVINNLALVRDLTRVHQLCNLNVIYDVQDYIRVVSTHFALLIIMAAYYDNVNLGELYTLTKTKFVHNHTTRGLCPSLRPESGMSPSGGSSAAVSPTPDNDSQDIPLAAAKQPRGVGVGMNSQTTERDQPLSLSNHRTNALAQHVQSSQRHSLMTPLNTSRRVFSFDAGDDALENEDLLLNPEQGTGASSIPQKALQQPKTTIAATQSSQMHTKSGGDMHHSQTRTTTTTAAPKTEEESAEVPMVSHDLLMSPTLAKAIEYVYIATHYPLASQTTVEKLPQLPFQFPPIIDILPQNILYLHSYMILEPLSSNVIGPGIQNILGTASLLLGNHNVPASVPLIPIRPHPVFINTSVVDSLFAGLTVGDGLQMLAGAIPKPPHGGSAPGGAPGNNSGSNAPSSITQHSQQPRGSVNADLWKDVITAITKDSTYSAVQYNALDIYGFYLTFAAFTDDGNAISMILPSQKLNKFNKLRQKRYITTAKGSLRHHLARVSRGQVSDCDMNTRQDLSPLARHNKAISSRARGSSTSEISNQPVSISPPPQQQQQQQQQQQVSHKPTETPAAVIRSPPSSPNLVQVSTPPSTTSSTTNHIDYHKLILLPSLAFALTVDVHFSAFRHVHIHTLLLSLISMLQTVDAPDIPPYYPDSNHFIAPGSVNAHFSSTQPKSPSSHSTAMQYQEQGEGSQHSKPAGPVSRTISMVPVPNSSIGIGVVGSGLAALVAFCSNVLTSTTDNSTQGNSRGAATLTPIERAMRDFTRGFSKPHIHTITTLLLTKSNNPTLHAVAKALLEDLLTSMSLQQIETLRRHLAFEWSKYLVQTSHFSIHYKSHTDIDCHSANLIKAFHGQVSGKSVGAVKDSVGRTTESIAGGVNPTDAITPPRQTQWISDPLLVAIEPPSFITLQYKRNFLQYASTNMQSIILTTKKLTATFVAQHLEVYQYILPPNSLYHDITALSHGLTIGSLPLPLLYFHVPIRPITHLMKQQRRYYSTQRFHDNTIYTGNGDLQPGVEISDAEVICLYLLSLLEITASSSVAAANINTTNQGSSHQPPRTSPTTEKRNTYHITSKLPSDNGTLVETAWNLHQDNKSTGSIFPCPSSSSNTYICNIVSGRGQFVREYRYQLITMHVLLQLQLCLSFWDIGCKTLAESNNVLRFLSHYYDPSHYSAFGVEYSEELKIPPPTVRVSYTINTGIVDPGQKNPLTTTVPIVLGTRTVNILTLLCRILARGYILWEPYIADKHDLIMKLHCLSQLTPYPSLAKNASQALLQIGRVTPKQFIHDIAYQLFSSFGVGSSTASHHQSMAAASSASLSTITNLQFNPTVAHISIEILKLNNDYMANDGITQRPASPYGQSSLASSPSNENEYDITLSINQVQTYNNPHGITVRGYTLIDHPGLAIYTVRSRQLEMGGDHGGSTSSSAAIPQSASLSTTGSSSSSSGISTPSFLKERSFLRRRSTDAKKTSSSTTQTPSTSATTTTATSDSKKDQKEQQIHASFDSKQFKKDHTISIQTLSQLPASNPSILSSLSNLIKKYPFAAYPHIPSIVQFIVTCLDPTTPLVRKAVIRHATLLIQTLVLKYPCVSFDKSTQRLLVSSNCHSIANTAAAAASSSSSATTHGREHRSESNYDLNSSLLRSEISQHHQQPQHYENGTVVCYDLRSGTKVKTLYDKNNSPITACALSPTTGQFCVTYSAFEQPQPVVKIWQLPSTGLFSSLFSSNVKCVQTHPLPVIHNATIQQQQYHSFQTIQKLMNVSITWEQELVKGGKHIIDVAVITREDGSVRKYTCQ